jgi:hypothetical protein
MVCARKELDHIVIGLFPEGHKALQGNWSLSQESDLRLPEYEGVLTSRQRLYIQMSLQEFKG